jgi:hypothetical protein
MVAFPFALAWWKDVHDNLDAIERGETPERESPRQRRIAVAASAAMLLFQIAMAVLGLTGRLEV